MRKLFTIALCTVIIPQLSSAQNIGIGTTAPNSKLDINGDIALRSASINIASTYTYALDVNTVKQANYRLTDNNAVGNFILAGITAGADGRQITLYNRTGSSMQIFDEDATAIAANRIHTGIATTLAVYNGGVVVLRYDASVNRWEVLSSHYSSLDYFGGGGSGNWDASGPDIYNSNTGNVGVGTNTPAAKLTVNGNLALVSDTVKVDCSFFPAKMIIDNQAKNKSVYHIINDGCGSYTPPMLAGLTGGADGKIITVISHVNSLQVLHLQANTVTPTAADSLNMIELYEPNGNGAINQPYSYTLNNGGSITLQYDAIRNKWKPLSINGEIKQDVVSWYRGSNQNDIYNPNSNNVGIGTGSPLEKLDVRGNVNIQGNVKINQAAGQKGQVLGINEAGNTAWISYCNYTNFTSLSPNGFYPVQTFTIPAGVKSFMVEGWSPGGGGAYGGGGGAGGYIAAIIKCAPLSVVTVTRTADGGAGASAIGGAGSSGGILQISGTGFFMDCDGGHGASATSPGLQGGGFASVTTADSVVCFIRFQGQGGSTSSETFHQKSSTLFTGVVAGGKGGDAFNNLSTGGSSGCYIYDAGNNNAIKTYYSSIAGFGSGGGSIGGPNGWGGSGGNALVIIRW